MIITYLQTREHHIIPVNITALSYLLCIEPVQSIPRRFILYPVRILEDYGVRTACNYHFVIRLIPTSFRGKVFGTCPYLS